MPLLLPKSIFIHIPKTGGSWVRAAIHNAGIPTDEIIPQSLMGAQWRGGICHADARGLRITNRFRFAFVRHPLTFYQSYWCYRMQKGWDFNVSIDRGCHSEVFEIFVRSVINMLPSGWVTGNYERYLGDNNQYLDFVGRMENLADDLVAALTLFGESFHEEALRATPPLNVASRLSDFRERCAYTRELRSAVCKVERKSMELFGYAEDESHQEVSLPKAVFVA